MADGQVGTFLRARRTSLVVLVVLAVLVIVAVSRLSPRGPLHYGDGACFETADGAVTCAIP